MITCTFENGDQGGLRHVTVGCLVIKDGEILLAKRSQGLIEAGKWCLLGGYVERGETVLEAGIRETMEESGWVIDNLRLLRVNDNPHRHHEDHQNVDFIYSADAVEKTGDKDGESEEVRWFPLDSLPPEEHMAFDHMDSIAFYKKHLISEFPLPFIGDVQPILSRD